MLIPRCLDEIEEIKVRIRAADAAGVHIRDGMQSTGIPGSTDWRRVETEAKELAAFAGWIADAIGDGNELYRKGDG